MELSYLPLDAATRTPENGFYWVLANRWWCYQPDKGLLLFAGNPQCNSNENLARSIRDRCWPDAEVIFIEQAYLPHDCQDYIL